jgi:GMP synthase-like glutamine amidotransferase
VLGSNHCANEPLPWIDAERCLLQDALAHDVPVLGHCFGAQMLARAMGGRVWRNPCPNIGWSQAWVTPQAQAPPQATKTPPTLALRAPCATARHQAQAPPQTKPPAQAKVPQQALAPLPTRAPATTSSAYWALRQA